VTQIASFLAMTGKQVLYCVYG